MGANPNQEPVSVKQSIVNVLARIRRTAMSRGKTELPTAEFSNALNSIGERFIDLLLLNERAGHWWLGENRQWLECTVQSTGRRVSRNFYPGGTTEPVLLESTSKHLADPMTGPDHIVKVSVSALDLNCNVVLEQKFRFSNRQDAFADSGTYLKHLLHKSGYRLPKGRDLDADSCCNDLLSSLQNVFGTTLGGVGATGTVPQVCFHLMLTAPNEIIVVDKESKKITKCDFVGFLPPIVSLDSVAKNSVPNEITRKAKVRLWLGLDSLLEACEEGEVQTAWNTAIAELSSDLHNPDWRVTDAEGADGD